LGVVYEDDSLIVLNKPAGLLTVPLSSSGDPSAYDQVAAYLRAQGSRRRPHIVHRIDRDTSGLVVFAKNERAQELLKDQFRRREPERIYWAVVYGRPEPPDGTWRDRLIWDQDALIQRRTHPDDPSGTDATSHYRVLQTLGDASLVEVRLETGKRNQIRIQARLRGHTLVGERRYTFGPGSLRPIEFARQALHARELAFAHPATGRPLRFEAPLPADLAELLTRLRSG
jgi:23S rRNA pseudouridine1911/1915/1917 synthase